MNLHNIVQNNVWFWLSNRGGNGRTMPTHLFSLNREPRQGIAGENQSNPIIRRWRDPFMAWRPFAMAESRQIHRNNTWTIPLCGKNSTSRFARANFAYNGDWNICRRCRQIEQERGIIGRYYNEFTTTDPEMIRLQQDEDTWMQQQENDMTLRRAIPRVWDVVTQTG